MRILKNCSPELPKSKEQIPGSVLEIPVKLYGLLHVDFYSNESDIEKNSAETIFQYFDDGSNTASYSRLCSCILQILHNLTFVDMEQAILWSQKFKPTFKEIRGLSSKIYKTIIGDDNEANIISIFKRGTIPKVLLTKKQVLDHINKYKSFISLKPSERRFLNTLIARLRGKTFSEAYNIGNPSNKSQNYKTRNDQGKNQCLKAHKVLEEKMWITFDLALISGLQ